MTTVQGRGEVVEVRGRLTPILRLGRFLGLRGPEPPAPGAEGIVVVVESGQDCRCLLVDDLLGRGLAVFVAVDAVASRHSLDHDVALRRLEGAGVVLTTSEAVLFEWCRSAEHPNFREVRTLVLDRPR